MRALFLAAGVFLSCPRLSGAVGAAGESAWSWHESTTPHFEVKRQDFWLPPGFLMGLERIHSRLRLDLSVFSPWMEKERVKLFLYKDRESYARGVFSPPPWSNGLAIYEQKAVAVYEQKEPGKLLELVAHETTHLLFESYWLEEKKHPPSWLNEGLAMNEEEDLAHPETSSWRQRMSDLSSEKMLPVARLVEIDPGKDLKDNHKIVELWYVESYSLVRFLLRARSRLQFKIFVEKLRDGKPLEESLWLSYRYRTLKQLEIAWQAWLKEK
jgi:hypothetical protein